MTRRQAKRRRAAEREARSGRRDSRSDSLDLVRIGMLLDRATLVLLCAKIAVVLLVFDRTTDVPFVVPKVLASHALSYVLLGLLATRVILGGFGALRWSLLHSLVLAFVGVNVVSAALGSDRTLALYGTHNRMLGLGTVIDGAVTFFCAGAVVTTYRRAAALVATLIGSTIVVLCYELIQLLGRDPFDWDVVVTISPISTLGQPTTLAYFLTSLAAFALALGALARIQILARAGLVTLAVVALLGALATGSRLTVVGIAVAGALLWLLLLFRQERARTRFAIGGVGVVATLTIAAVVALSPLGARLATSVAAAATADIGDDLLEHFDPSTAGRLTLYGMALDMTLDRPFLGFGPDNFAAAMPMYRPAGAPSELRQPVITSAHSWIAQLAATTGVLGLLAFVGLVGAAFWLAFRDRRDLALVLAVTLAAHLAAGAVTVSENSTDFLTWMILGGIASATRSPQADTARRQRPRLTFGAVIGLAVALLFGVVGVASVLAPLDASRAARLSQDARQFRQVPEAISAAVRATALDPQRAEYWRKLALAYAAGRRWNDAAAAFEQASRLAPYDIHNLGDQIAAKVSNNDDPSRAGLPELARRMEHDDPNNPYAYLTTAAVMQLAGRQDDAVAAIERALELDPGSNNVGLYTLAAQLFMTANRSADAERVAQEGIRIVDPTQASQRSVPLRYEHARALASLGRTAEALAELDIVIRYQPTNTAAVQLRTQLQSGR